MKILIALLLITSSYAKSLEVMIYNVENLFDTVHDEGKNDWTFLPNSTKGKKDQCKKVRSNYRREECYTTDWTDKKLKIKLSQIKDVVLKERKKLPAIMGLAEIENANVVGMLAKELGYKKFFTSNSPDKRGIDLGIMFNETKNLKFVKTSELSVSGDYFKKRPTRNIFEVEFKVGGHPLHVFINHWPSLGNPDHARVTAAKTLLNRINEIVAANKNASVVAMGDFNTIKKLKKKGNKHPYRDIFLNKTVMRDLHDEFMNSKKVAKSLKSAQPPGTYFYKRGNEWNRLDRVFINTALMDGKGLDVEVSSYNIYAPKFIRQVFDNPWEDDEERSNSFKKKNASNDAPPKRYDHKARSKDKAGYSDHLPIVFNLKW